MATGTDARPTQLAKGELLLIRAGNARHVSVPSGRVWLTRERDPSDLVLHGGESVALAGAGLVVVEALEPADIAVSGTGAISRVPLPVPLRDDDRYHRHAPGRSGRRTTQASINR